MKKIIDAIIVVEGKSDVSYLSSFIDAEFVITNGSEVPESMISYLKNSNKKIIVLTDPDYPGKQIRDRLDQNIPNLFHVFINKEKAIKHGKVGVAEADKEEILNALNNEWVSRKNVETISYSDLYDLGLVGSANAKTLRDKVSKKLYLGHVNAKTFLKRINSKGITIEELQKLL